MDGSGGSAGAMCLMSWAFDHQVIICSTNICRCVAPEVTGLEGGPSYKTSENTDFGDFELHLYHIEIRTLVVLKLFNVD